MVQDAKHVAINPADTAAVSRWRESNKAVSKKNSHLFPIHATKSFYCSSWTLLVKYDRQFKSIRNFHHYLTSILFIWVSL